MIIDWSDPTSKISEHFTVHDALWLPSWQVMHVPSEAEKANILAMAEKMELIRAFLEKPINVHCWIRPTNATVPGTKWDKKNYNSFVGGAPGSAHIDGNAVDWNPSAMVCGDAKALLLPKLEEFQIRMENNDGGNWVHNDRRQPAPKKSRFFRP